MSLEFAQTTHSGLSLFKHEVVALGRWHQWCCREHDRLSCELYEKKKRRFVLSMNLVEIE